MSIFPRKTDERVEAVYFTRSALIVDLRDGRSISVPLQWYPKLLKATPEERAYWKVSGGGYGIHWPKIDEDLSTEGLLRGAPAPNSRKSQTVRKTTRRNTMRFGRSRRVKHKN